MNQLARKSISPLLKNALPKQGGHYIHQKRPIYFAVPVLLPLAVGAFVGITIYQVYKKRQAEERGDTTMQEALTKVQQAQHAEADARLQAQLKAQDRAKAQVQAQTRSQPKQYVSGGAPRPPEA